MKTILKMLAGFLAGAVIGLGIAMLFIVGFTDSTFGEFMAKLRTADFAKAMGAAAFAILVFAVSVPVMVTGHEAGHLVCGLLSGYKFVSFRIFSYTIIRIDGKLRIKRFAVAGTGGQCLLAPPDLPLDEIPTGWYNFGGVFANILMVLAALPLLFVGGHPLLTEAAAIFMLTGGFLILINGIPMKINGAGNDGYNMFALRKNPLSKRALVEALRGNALMQSGVRVKDMPAEWFEVPPVIDYSNQLEVSIPLMAASRLIDEMKFGEALERFEMIYGHKDEIIGLYVNEIACELVFLRLVCGNKEGAEALLDEKLKKYIEAFRKMMSSKERVVCALKLYIDNDRAGATAVYEELRRREEEYLLQGEVKSDLAIMKHILEEN